MYDPVEEEGHLVRHIMASLSAYKSAIISQCHLSPPHTLEDNNAWAKGDDKRSVYVLYGLSVALSTTLLSTAMKCVLISSGANWALEVIMITSFVSRSSTNKVYIVPEGGGGGSTDSRLDECKDQRDIKTRLLYYNMHLMFKRIHSEKTIVEVSSLSLCKPWSSFWFVCCTAETFSREMLFTTTWPGKQQH